jgi:hypothetical protein
MSPPTLVPALLLDAVTHRLGGQRTAIIILDLSIGRSTILDRRSCIAHDLALATLNTATTPTSSNTRR